VGVVTTVELENRQVCWAHIDFKLLNAVELPENWAWRYWNNNDCCLSNGTGFFILFPQSN